MSIYVFELTDTTRQAI